MPIKVKIIQPSGNDVVNIFSRMIDRRATVGRAYKDAPKSHIIIRGAPATISHRHFTFKVTNGDDLTLHIRDGSMEGSGWEPSNNGTWVDGKRIDPRYWVPLRLDSRITFAPPGKDFIGGLRVSEFAVVVAPDNEGFDQETLNDGQTVAFDAIQIWQSASQISPSGVLLLRQIEGEPGRALILKADATGEAALQYQPGELQNYEGQIVINSIVAEKSAIAEQITQSLQQQSHTEGMYTVRGQQVSVGLVQRYIGSEQYLLAYVSEKASPQSDQDQSWQAIGIKEWFTLAQKNPALALLVLAAVVAILVLALSG